MSFHSVAFLLFAPVAFLGHALLRGRAMRVWLVVMSYVFYGWGYPWYCFLLLASTVLDFIVAQRVEAAASRRAKRAWLLLSLSGNLGLLGVFKYLGFAAQTVNRLGGILGAGWTLPVPDLVLPIGISFYTFQTLSYTIDVYRGRMRATRSFSTMALYVAFFPQLVAGPIERAPHLMGQLMDKQPRSAEDVFSGCSRILWGLMKKLVFADWLGLFVTQVYAQPGAMSTGELWLATYAFAFQIYLDFSAYTDIAIGLARAMGIRLRENFRWPYLSRNLSEFWTRWHISLSGWLRDYLYIPLGGSRRGLPRTVWNVVIVMLLGGLWHGAAMTFIVWGLWIGVGLAAGHAYAARVPADRDAERPIRWREAPAILLTFHWMALSWVCFRASSVSDAFGMLRRMLLLAPSEGIGPMLSPEIAWRTLVLIAAVLLAHVIRGTGRWMRWENLRTPVTVGALWGALLVFMALAYAPAHEPFIYFRF